MTTTPKKAKAVKGNDVKVKTSQRQLDPGITIKQGFPEISTGGLPTTMAQDLSNMFFNWPTARPDGIFQPLLCEVADHLTDKGVSAGNIQASQVILMTFNSARLGYPLSTLLRPEEPMHAVDLLYKCINLAPQNSIIEFQRMRPEQLFIGGGEHYRNRCVVSPDPDGFNKVHQDIELMLTRGYTTRQEFVNKKFAVSLEEYRAEFPLSFIGVDNGKGNKLDHPSIIRLPIKANASPVGPDLLSNMDSGDHQPASVFRIRKTFERLKSRPVVIPFAEQLWKSLSESGGDHVDTKMMVLANMISLCTIINQPPPVTMVELGGYLYGTDEETVRNWLIKTGKFDASTGTEDITDIPLTATKVDYYIGKWLLDGLLITGNNYLTERQRRIYEAVLRINMAKLSTAILEKDDDIEKVATISRSSSYWAPREKVFEEANKDGGQYLSLSTVNNELIGLMKMGILDRSKPPKSRHFGYYVMTLNVGGAISLPSPSDIVDPIYKGKPVEVINPITGQAEKI